MELADSLTDSRRQGILITGNGVSDIKLLRLIMRVIDGEKPFLASPTLPFPHREGITGLNALSIIGTGLDRFGIRTCLFCIDREHVESINAVKRALNKHGFEIKILKELELRRAYEIDAYRGPKTVKIFLVIFGHNKSIEEDIAELARISGCSLPNNRITTIRRELIPKVRKKDVKKAFKHLYIALTELKEFLKF